MQRLNSLGEREKDRERVEKKGAVTRTNALVRSNTRNSEAQVCVCVCHHCFIYLEVFFKVSFKEKKVPGSPEIPGTASPCTQEARWEPTSQQRRKHSEEKRFHSKTQKHKWQLFATRLHRIMAFHAIAVVLDLVP